MSGLSWTAQQEDALRAVRAWKANGYQPQVFRLFGFAGTGKTMLALAIDYELTGGQAAFGAYTGKACQVLREAGCLNAQTLHRWIYKVTPLDTKTLDVLAAERDGVLHAAALITPEVQAELDALDAKIAAERALLSQADLHVQVNLDGDFAAHPLGIIDECSMVDADMAADLESFGKPLVVIGDPMQLPPPEGAGYYIKDQPDILLTEVHSTARDNPIIALATKARLGEPIAQGSYGKSLVVHKRDLKLVDWMHCDQVICGTNVSRHATNTYWRQNLGLDIAANPLPLWGERVVCLKNSRQHDLWNGTTHTVAADSKRLLHSPDMMFLTLNDQDPQAGDRLLEAWTFPFLDGRNVEQWRKGAVWFDYGYALTAHKAQGSRWPKVGIKCDWAWKASQAQWLYTAITRASDRVLIVQGMLDD